MKNIHRDNYAISRLRISILNMVFLAMIILTIPVTAQLPQSFSVNVDKGDGTIVELNLTKFSVRSPNFRVVTWDSTDGYVEVHTAGNPSYPARTYRGFVTQNPNELVVATVMSANTLEAEVHNGSGRLWSVSGIDVTTELGNGTLTAPPSAPLSVGAGTPPAEGQPGAHVPPIGLYTAHGVEDVPSSIYDAQGQSISETIAWIERQWNVQNFFNTRDAKLSIELSEMIIRKEQFYFPPNGDYGAFNGALRAEWLAQGQNPRGFIHSWFPHNFSYAGGYNVGKSMYAAGGEAISVNALYHEVAHAWRAKHYFYGVETMTGSHPSHGEMNTQLVLYTRQIEIDEDDGILPTTSYAMNMHPRAYQDIASTLVDTAVVIAPLENDYDANGDAITIKSFDATTAKGGAVTESGGVLTYTPPNGYVGKDIVAYEIQDTAGLYTRAAIHIEVVNLGLAAHWTMDETSGTSAADASGNGHPGDLVGADFSANSVSGPVGNAISLGASDYIIGDSSDLIQSTDTSYPLDSAASNFFDPMDQSFTASSWIKLDEGTTSATVLSKINGANLGYKIDANTSYGVTASLRVWDGFKGTYSVSSGAGIVEDTWYHVAMVINRDDETLRLYVNGAEVGSPASLPAGFFIFNGREDFKIGGAGAIAVDDTRVYTKALSLAEVQALHTVGDIPAGVLSPVNGAVAQATSTTQLSWVPGQSFYQHDVYFGTDATAVASATTASPEYKGRQSETFFNPATLDYSKNYFWRIDEVDGSNIIIGSVWQFATAATAMTQNLVLHLTMDNNDVQTANGSTHTYDDIAFPAQDFQTLDSVAAGSPGIIGQSVDLNGSADTLRSYDLNVINRPVSGGVTISFWMNTTSTQGSVETIYDIEGVYYMRYDNGDLQPVFNENPSGAVSYDTNINDGQWHHIVAQNDGANLTSLYVDGVLVGTQAESLYDLGSLDRGMGIGSVYGGTVYNMNASFDDFAVWERALSSAEITAIYTAGLAGNSFNDVPVLVDSSFEAAEGFSGYAAAEHSSLGTVVDNDGVIWTEVSDARIWNRVILNPDGLQGLALGIGGGPSQVDVTIPGVAHGMGIVTFDYASWSGSTNVTFRLLYNDNNGSGWVEAWSTQMIGSNPGTGPERWKSAEVAVNVPGNVDLRFEQTGIRGIVFDNVKVLGLGGAFSSPPNVVDGVFAVAENAGAGASVGTVVATDPNVGDTLTYAITAGNSAGLFAIDDSGSITTTADLDSEATNQHVLTVTASDNGGLTGSGTIIVDVTNINEDPPTVNDASGSVAEDVAIGTSVVIVTGTDPDFGDTLTYSITAGNTGGAFSINSTTGEITTAATLDFETISSYALTVQVADDGGLTDTATVAVNVSDVPTDDTDGDGVLDALEIALGTDPNSAASTPGSSYVNLLAWMKMDEGTGSTSLDSSGYGRSGALTGSPEWTAGYVGAQAVDFDGVDDTIEVTPFIGGTSNTATMSGWIKRNGNQTDYSGVVFMRGSGFAAGVDIVGNTLRYHWNDGQYTWNSGLTPPDGEWCFFSLVIEPTQATMYMGTQDGTLLSAENVEAHTAVTLTAPLMIGQDTYSASRRFKGGIDDVRFYGRSMSAADVKSLFDEQLVNTSPVANDDSFAIAEDSAVGASVGTVVATDVNTSDTLSYSITAGNSSGGFAINGATGEITTVAALDYEIASQYVLTVTVSDDGTPVESDTASITINVIDVNETPVANNGVGSVDENVSAGAVIATVIATDQDAGDTLNYAITSGNTGDVFAINSGTGAITTTAVLDHEVAAQYVLTITVTDSGLLTGTATITVDVNDVNEAPSANDNSGSVAENLASGIVVATVAASDPDSGDTLSYAITAGNTGNSFTIDNSGTITTATSLNYESIDAYALTVTVTDIGVLSDTATVTIDVANINEAPTANDASGTVAEDVAIGTSVATVTTSDPDAGDSVSYSITAGNTGNAFSIDSIGNITTTAPLDYETLSSYTLTVTVTDAGFLTDTAIVGVTVSDVVETIAPVVATGSASNLTQTSVDISYSVTEDGGESPTVTVYYGETNGGTVPDNWTSSAAQGAKATGGYIAPLSGLTAGTSYYFTVHASNSAGESWGSTGSFTTTVDASPKLVRTTVSAVSNSSWTTVNLGQSYTSAVIIATPIYPNTSTPPVVTRITNVSGSNFDLKVDRADGLTTAMTIDVSIIAVEEGLYTQATDGVTMEAVKYTSTVTAENNSWVSEAQTYQNTYTAPVVVGQVMSANDTNWSVFWSMGSSRTAPASASVLNVGKHVGEDSNTTRANETIGYIVIESGSGTINGVAYEAALGGDKVRGFGNSPSPYTYTLSGGLSTVSAAAASISGMDGVNGAWAVLSGSPALTTTSIGLHALEDQINDAELSHTTTQVGYIVFE